MAVESLVTIQADYSGDFTASFIQSALANAASPAQSDIVTLASGANTITKPAGGSTVTGLIIIPPSANAIQITLKGVTGDTGILLHLTNPVYIPLAASFASLVLNAASQITGVRLLWT